MISEPEPGALAPGESFQVEALLTDVGTYDCAPTNATMIQVLVTSDSAGPGIDAPAALQVCGDAWRDFSARPSGLAFCLRPMPRRARPGAPQ